MERGRWFITEKGLKLMKEQERLARQHGISKGIDSELEMYNSINHHGAQIPLSVFHEPGIISALEGRLSSGVLIGQYRLEDGELIVSKPQRRGEKK